jgi:hypothetical protein
VLWDPKKSWAGIAGLSLRRNRANLDVPKAQSVELTHELCIFVEACGHADAIWKSDPCHNNLLAG